MACWGRHGAEPAADAALRSNPRRVRAEDTGNPSTPGLRRGGSMGVFEARPHWARLNPCDAEPPPGQLSGCFHGVAESRFSGTFRPGTAAETGLRLPSRREGHSGGFGNLAPPSRLPISFATTTAPRPRKLRTSCSIIVRIIARHFPTGASMETAFCCQATTQPWLNA